MTRSFSSDTQASIPTYGLYGESASLPEPEWIHWETVPTRSRLHGYEIRPHRHASLFQILHITNGEAEARLDVEDVVLRAPVALLIPPLSVHGYRFSADVDGTVVTVLEERMDRIWSAMPDAARRCDAGVRVVGLRDPDDDKAVADALVMLGEEYLGHGSGRMAVMEACVTLATARLDRAATKGAQDASGAAGATSRTAARFRSLVEENFRHERRVAFYAERLGLTPTHLGRICRAAYGAAPLALINRRVALEAQRSLVFTISTVADIAVSLGFSDTAYFTRFFTRECGVSPMEYRRRALAKG
ncbi:helix-turn-helix domain-containing protein [Lutibaculum baratangense]|nr:helix-turn-helix domain-containing protein [Lutibaculum baratangense]